MKVDKELVRNNFSRAAVTYEQHSIMQQEIGSSLLNAFPEDFNPAKVLDVGCATGLLTEKIAHRFTGEEITAIDISEEMIKLARTQHSHERIDYLSGDVEIFWPHNDYDLVFSNATLQWLNDLPAFFKKVYSSLKNGGYFCLSVFFNKTFSRIRKMFQDNNDYRISHTLPAAEQLAVLVNDPCFEIMRGDVKIKEEIYKGFMDFMKNQRLSGTLNASPVTDEQPRRGFRAVRNVLNASIREEGPFIADYQYGEYILRKIK